MTKRFFNLVAVCLTCAASGISAPAWSATDPYIGEIMLFGGNFCPRGWSPLDGALLNVSQNQALFSILGTTYGGDGRTTFALPDLRGRLPMHAGTGPGLTTRRLGQRGGAETQTLTAAQMPPHSHSANALTTVGDQTDPAGNLVSAQPRKNKIYGSANSQALTQMHGSAIGPAGGGQPHDNMPPYLTVQFCIAVQGLYPSRN